MKLTKPQIEYLKKCDRDGPLGTNPSTGNTAKALAKRGLVKSWGVYQMGKPREYQYLLGFEFGITNEGRQALRELEPPTATWWQPATGGCP